MFAFGLTGGIGSGKSTVADMLCARGAVLVDADLIAREVVVPGGPAYPGLVERFGTGILAQDGTIDRPALAALAFASPAAVADLNAITHPAISATMAARLAVLADSDVEVVVAIPLLVPKHKTTLPLSAFVVVDCPREVAISRLVTLRNMTKEDAEARIAVQMTREDRLALADFVIDNSSTPEHLAAEVDRLWQWIQVQRQVT